MGFGTEILLLALLGFLVLGPKQMQAALKNAARAKAAVDRAKENFQSQLTAHRTATPPSSEDETQVPE